MGWTRPGTVATGDLIDQDLWNVGVVDDREFLHKTPFCHVYASTAVEIANGSLTAVEFDAEFHDTDGMHDTVTNPDRITVQEAGVYGIAAMARWESVAGTSFRSMEILVNGTAIVAEYARFASLAADQNISTVYKAGAGDYFQLQVFQSSGGTLDLLYFANLPPQMQVAWLGAGTA